MKIIESTWGWIRKPVEPLKDIEIAARNCWQSQNKIVPGSDQKIVKMLIKKGHLTPLEFEDVKLRIITNRSVMAELTRHRLCSFCILSTRYVKYNGDMVFIRPVWWDKWSLEEQNDWYDITVRAEKTYAKMIKAGSRPEQAREILPHSLGTEIVMKCNFRELRLILKLRCSLQAHPEIRKIMRSILVGVHQEIPVVFDDIYDEVFPKGSE